MFLMVPLQVLSHPPPPHLTSTATLRLEGRASLFRDGRLGLSEGGATGTGCGCAGSSPAFLSLQYLQCVCLQSRILTTRATYTLGMVRLINSPFWHVGFTQLGCKLLKDRSYVFFSFFLFFCIHLDH